MPRLVPLARKSIPVSSKTPLRLSRIRTTALTVARKAHRDVDSDFTKILPSHPQSGCFASLAKFGGYLIAEVETREQSHRYRRLQRLFRWRAISGHLRTAECLSIFFSPRFWPTICRLRVGVIRAKGEPTSEMDSERNFAARSSAPMASRLKPFMQVTSWVCTTSSTALSTPHNGTFVLFTNNAGSQLMSVVKHRQGKCYASVR